MLKNRELQTLSRLLNRYLSEHVVPDAVKVGVESAEVEKASVLKSALTLAGTTVDLEIQTRKNNNKNEDSTFNKIDDLSLPIMSLLDEINYGADDKHLVIITSKKAKLLVMDYFVKQSDL